MQFSTSHIKKDFERLYIGLRRQEGWTCSDEELIYLPSVPRNHPHVDQWQARKESARRLITYLKKKTTPITILEVGSGNGWLSSIIASIIPGAVTGIDINHTELQQARRVFSHQENLRFLAADLRQDLSLGKRFDTIIFAASIQYFPFFTEIIDCALHHLQPGGEIHVLDSPFYPEHEIIEAQKRSLDHFSRHGFAAMAPHYFHHNIAALEQYNHKLLYNPQLPWHRIRLRRNPFPHFLILNKK